MWRIFSTVEDIQYCGEILLVLWRDTIITVKDIQYCGEILLVLWRDTIITVPKHQHEAKYRYPFKKDGHVASLS